METEMFLKKEVKYRVTEPFASLDEGMIINTILLIRHGNNGLIYHPHVRGECPSIEVVVFLPHENVWVAGKNNFVDIEEKPTIFEKFLMGKDFKFKRQFYDGD